MIEIINHFAKSNRVAIIDNDVEFSYANLSDKIFEFSQFLKQNGVKPGEIVAMRGKYSFENIALFLALYQNKNIITLLPNQSQINNYLNSSNSNKLITCERDIINLNPQISDQITTKLKGQSGLILFSSGTLGMPKAILHSLDRLIQSHKDKKERNLKVLLFLLFDHIGGINSLLLGLCGGLTLVISKDFTPQNICKNIEKFGVNILPTTPSFLNLLLLSNECQKNNLSSLKLITYGTEPMNEGLLKRLKTTFPKVKFSQTFGTSETGILQTVSKSSNSIRFKLPKSEYKIIDGRLFLRSDTMFLGYLNNNDINANNKNNKEWFDTGDLVCLDKDGFLQILGREGQMINVAGNKLLACEVESCIMELEEIKDVIVYGQKSLITGQMVVCDVVSRLDENTIKELVKSHCKARLERYKVPLKVNLVNQIELTKRFKKSRKQTQS